MSLLSATIKSQSVCLGEKRKLEGDKKQQSINSCHEKWAHQQNNSMLFKQGRTKLKPNTSACPNPTTYDSF